MRRRVPDTTKITEEAVLVGEIAADAELAAAGHGG